MDTGECCVAQTPSDQIVPQHPGVDCWATSSSNSQPFVDAWLLQMQITNIQQHTNEYDPHDPKCILETNYMSLCHTPFQKIFRTSHKTNKVRKIFNAHLDVVHDAVLFYCTVYDSTLHRLYEDVQLPLSYVYIKPYSGRQYNTLWLKEHHINTDEKG
ncbi:unnamed protein product [Acanthoscelides obtectus]|uniref:Uncharacterized protein n=1 Tax=Acanthoscelides obtectus TaxID=200917 RepID=A0A9P0P7F2_ACAOB|nr:unnamed protein product [Acanthoscelides obtectus]CAK1656673.1 hypothetical protein AOBTE_LOCUS19862 [Acanthoscelides obtectus]